jgi:hypothetical protein
VDGPGVSRRPRLFILFKQTVLKAFLL